MNKNIIKIGVPIIVLVAILNISDSIEGQTCSVSKDRYDKLYRIISTESSITASTEEGQGPLLSPQDAKECFENAFKAYFPIFGSDANRLFSSSTWGEGELSRIRTESQRLLTLNGSESAKDSLNNYINYVKGYYSATRLLSQSRYCNSAASYDFYIRSARAYKTYPYNNNLKLRNITSDVANNAQAGWRNAITNYVENVCNNPNDYYSSYNDFYTGDYQKAYQKISEYNSKFHTTWGSDLKAKLKNKDSQVKSHFNN